MSSRCCFDRHPLKRSLPPLGCWFGLPLFELLGVNRPEHLSVAHGLSAGVLEELYKLLAGRPPLLKSESGHDPRAPSPPCSCTAKPLCPGPLLVEEESGQEESAGGRIG